MRIEAKTLEEAYVIAANKLNCSVTDLEIEIIQHPRRGIFGLFAKIKLRGWGIPVIAVVSILLTYLFGNYAVDWFDGYQFGFELLLLNGMITFAFLWILGKILKSQALKSFLGFPILIPLSLLEFQSP